MAYLNLKKLMYDEASLIFLLVIAFYFVQLILSTFLDFFPPLFDSIAAIVLLLFVLALHLVYRFNKFAPLFLGIGLFFNSFGLYKIIPYNKYYFGTLYGAPQLGYHYDWIVHLFGFGSFALAFCLIIHPYLSKVIKSQYLIFLIILMSMAGFGALNEVNEFIGYTTFGIGEGFLEYGAGDFSPNGGPWENACMDLVNNLIGGILFIGLFVLDKKYLLFQTIDKFINKAEKL